MFFRRNTKKPIVVNPCPVCGYLTLGERGLFHICHVCFWEDEGVSFEDELPEAQNNFRKLGSCEISSLAYVRPPLSSELVNGLPDPEEVKARQEKAREKYGITPKKITDL